MKKIRFLWILSIFGLSFGFTQTIQGYAYTADKVSTYTVTPPWDTVSTYYNATTTTQSWSQSWSVTSCYSWGVSLTILKTYSLGSSTSGCTTPSTKTISLSVPAGKTGYAYKRKPVRDSTYYLYKTPYYSNGTTGTKTKTGSAVKTDKWTEYSGTVK